MPATIVSLRGVASPVVERALATPELTALAIGAVVLLVGAFLLARRLRRWWRVRRDERRSRRGHERARDRDPPVSIGEEYTVGVQEFSHHHSGERHAVAKVEGFVLFVTDVPRDVERADTIRISVLSFNRGRTSATATFLGRG